MYWTPCTFFVSVGKNDGSNSILQSSKVIEISILPNIPLGKHSIDLYMIGELTDGFFEQTIQVEFDINIFQSGFPIEIGNEVVSSPIFVNSESENTGIIFCDKDGLIYIGESSNICERYNTHSNVTYFSALNIVFGVQFIIFF